MAEEATKRMQEYLDTHKFSGDATIFMTNEAVQLAIASGTAQESTSVVLSDRQYFRDQDLTSPYLNLALVLNTKETQLKQVIWPGEGPLCATIAVSSTAIREGVETFNLLKAQYPIVDLRMIIFTPHEKKLHEGADFLADTLNFGIDAVSLLNRSLSLQGDNGKLHAWVVTSQHTTRLNPFVGRPVRKMITLLPPGSDPLKLFVTEDKQTGKRAIAINNKWLDQMVKDLGISEGHLAICPGPHPTQTSWVIFHPAHASKEALEKVETAYFQKENFAMVPWEVQQGELGPCEIIAEAWITKKMQSHQTLTTFWATVHYHLQTVVDKLQQAPRLQYEATNKLRLGFPKKADAEIFMATTLQTLKSLGMAFKTEGTKSDYWDADGAKSTTTSRSNRSWATQGTKESSCDEDRIVLVDFPEYLSPTEVLNIMKGVFQKADIPLQDTKIELQRLKWSMGSLRKPNWLLKAPAVRKLAGATVTIASHSGSHSAATVRSYADWDKAFKAWQNRDKMQTDSARPNQAKQTPSSLLRNVPSPAPPPVPAPVSVGMPPPALPNILPPPQNSMFYQPKHPSMRNN